MDVKMLAALLQSQFLQQTFTDNSTSTDSQNGSDFSALLESLLAEAAPSATNGANNTTNGTDSGRLSALSEALMMLSASGGMNGDGLGLSPGFTPGLKLDPSQLSAGALPLSAPNQTYAYAYHPLQQAGQFDNLIDQTAQRYGVNPDLVKGVIRQESGFNPYATSSVGAAGLMQLMPDTARSLGVTNVFDAAQNIDGGVKYLKQLLDRYQGDVSKALAAYNAGPGNVDRYGGVPPFGETRRYVSSILSSLPTI